MSRAIDRTIFKYIAIYFLVYVAIYIAYMNFGRDSNFWNTVYFINENVFVINLLYAITRIIDEKRLRIFAYIAIGFKLMICVIDGLAYSGVAIVGTWPEFVIASYWIITLTFYLYVSNKGLHQ